MPRSVEGLDSAGEWPAFQSLLPDLRGKRLLDLGCDLWLAFRYTREQGPRFVRGVDLSEEMLNRARYNTHDSAVEFRRSAIEDLDFAAEDFDIVINSLALRYVAYFDLLCRKIVCWHQAGGRFVFSVEHPIFTATRRSNGAWADGGKKSHWPVDHYADEGPRRTQ